MWFTNRSDTNRDDGWRLEVLDFCTIHAAKTKALISFAVLRSYCEADLHLCFHTGKNWFSDAILTGFWIASVIKLCK